MKTIKSVSVGSFVALWRRPGSFLDVCFWLLLLDPGLDLRRPVLVDRYEPGQLDRLFALHLWPGVPASSLCSRWRRDRWLGHSIGLQRRGRHDGRDQN